MAAVNFTRCNFTLRSNSKECFAQIGQFQRAISQSGNHKPPHFSCAMEQAANSSRKAHVALKSTEQLKLLDDLRRGVNQRAASKKYGHKLNYEPSNTKIIFMLSNTTLLIQPLDQGIIGTVKVYYRTQLIRQMVIAIDNGAIGRFCNIRLCIEGFIYVKACILFAYSIYHLKLLQKSRFCPTCSETRTTRN